MPIPSPARPEYPVWSVPSRRPPASVPVRKSNCILRSNTASSVFSRFSLSSFFHSLPVISCNRGISFSSIPFFSLYWSMMPGIRSSALRKLLAAAWVSAIARCPLLYLFEFLIGLSRDKYHGLFLILIR